MQSSDNTCPSPKRAENAGTARVTPRNLRDVIGPPASAHDAALGRYSMSTPFLPARLKGPTPRQSPTCFHIPKAFKKQALLAHAIVVNLISFIGADLRLVEGRLRGHSFS